MQIHRILIPLFVVLGIAVAQNATRPPTAVNPPGPADVNPTAPPVPGMVVPAAAITPAAPTPARAVPVAPTAPSPVAPVQATPRPQVPVPARPPIPGVNPALPPAPAVPAAANDQNIPLSERKITEAIIQPKLNGTDLAHYYTKFTGRRVVPSAAAAAAEFSFVQDPPLTYGEAAKLLKMAALIENFVFVPSGEPNTDKLLSATAGLNPKGAGVGIYNESDELPAGDEVISYVMTFKYLKPEEAVRTFTQIIGQFGAFGSITAVPNAAAVVITENTSLIRKLIQFKGEIDKPSGDVGTRFIKVQFADVESLAETLNQMLGAQQQSKTSAGIQRTQTPAPGMPPGGAAVAAAMGAATNPGGSSSGEDTPIQVIPDTRTNRIFAMGRPVDLLFVEGLVHEFDTPSDQKNFLRRKLRFLSVGGFLPVASNALERAFGGKDSGGASSTGGKSGGSNSGNRQQSAQNAGTGTGANFGGNIRNSGSSNSRSSGSSGGMGGGTGTMSTQGLGTPNTDTSPESVLVGRTLLVADNITNSIVVQGTPASVEIINKLLDEIDMKPDQVMISTVFGQLDLNDDTNFGVNLLQGLNGSKNFAGQSTGTGAPYVDLAKLLANGVSALPSGTGTGPGAGIYGTLSKNLSVYVQALQETGHFNVISRPTIYTANNQKGMISSGTQIAVPTNSYNYGGTTTGQSTNIEYRDVQLQLEVIPLVNSNNEVTLQISLISQDLGKSRPIGTGDNKLITNDIINRQILTTVTVPDNQTVVLGGLITATDSDSVSGVPVLSSIPYLGKLFSTTTKVHDRKELLFFLTPKIIHDVRSLEAAQTDMNGRYAGAGSLHTFENNTGVLPPKGSAMEIPVNGEGPLPAEEPTKRPVHKASSRPKALFQK